MDCAPGATHAGNAIHSGSARDPLAGPLDTWCLTSHNNLVFALRGSHGGDSGGALPLREVAPMVEDAARQRIENAPVVMALGAALGVFIALGAVGLLVWMEGRTIHTAVGLEQGAAVAVTVAPDRVDPANEGKLVHLTAEAAAAGDVADPDFGGSARVLRLAREVELYQWQEKKNESKKDGKTIVTYTYTQVWSKDRPQKRFAESDGHVNPPDKPYPDATRDA